MEDLYSVDFGYHWHYRPFGSLSRNQFTEMLKDNNFNLESEWKEKEL